MLFALIVASLVAAIAVSIAYFLQGYVLKQRQEEVALQRRILELARRSGGVVTPQGVAEELGLVPLDADRLLRGMVDDVHFTMELDVQAAELRFSIIEASAPPKTKGRRRSTLRPS